MKWYQLRIDFRKTMNEAFLSYLWLFQLIDKQLYSTEGEEIVIKKQGLKNEDAGPDFSNALIKIGNSLWAGNIEIHVKTSDWFKHKHQYDEKYQSVILHIVYEDDLQKKDQEKLNIPCLELKGTFDSSLFLKYESFMNNMNWIPCENQIKNINRFRFYYFISRMAVERLESKAENIQTQLQENKNNLEQTFYEQLARNFGFKTNADAFEMLAKSLPINYLAKQKSNLLQIEALLFGQAGMLKKSFKTSYPNLLKNEYEFLQSKYNLKPIPKQVWKFLRLRPSNFPTIRISQFANLIYLSSALLSQIIEAENLDQLRNYFDVSANEYWETHFNFDKESNRTKKHLGTQSTNLIIINTIIPFLFVYGKLMGDDQHCQKALKYLETSNGEQNNIIRQWKKLGINTKSAFFTQALLHLKNEYCDKKRCLDCQIGHELLKQTENNMSF